MFSSDTAESQEKDRQVRGTLLRHRTNPRGLRVTLGFPYFISNVWPANCAKGELPMWSPALFAGDHRANENVETVGAFVVDVDVWSDTIDTFVKAFARALRCAADAHTSYSSEPDALRLRGIATLSRPATVEEHGLLWPLWVGRLTSAGVNVDMACRDASRGYFVPAIPPSGHYEWRSVRGPVLDVDRDLVTARARAAKETAEREARRAARPAPVSHPGRPSALERARLYASKVPGAVAGQGGSTQTFTLAVRLVHGFGLRDDQVMEILQEWNASCEPPWSERELDHKIKSARCRGRLDAGHLLAETRRSA